MVPRWQIFGDFLGPALTASCMLRLGDEKKKIERKKKAQNENIMVCPIP